MQSSRLGATARVHQLGGWRAGQVDPYAFGRNRAIRSAPFHPQAERRTDIRKSVRDAGTRLRVSSANYLHQIGRLRFEQFLVGHVDDTLPLRHGERGRAVDAEVHEGMRLAGRFRDTGVTGSETDHLHARRIRKLLPARHRRHGRRRCPVLRPVERQRDVQLTRSRLQSFITTISGDSPRFDRGCQEYSCSGKCSKRKPVAEIRSSNPRDHRRAISRQNASY